MMTENQYENNRNFSTFVENFKKTPKLNRLAYEKLVSAKQSSPRKSLNKWCVLGDGLQIPFLH